ncbi:MAG: outer membrane lipoprotein chaperone LolA [Burkholderiales bacterium]|nr:outer membrane lipoprotein chaperone LolA [Burkholderiales bacterium]
MRKYFHHIALFCILNVFYAVSLADGRLQEFISGTRTLSAQFTQVVYDRNGRKLQESQGSLLLARPGRFRWVYERPYSQVVVGDGSRVWFYDQDLEQVTVRKLDQALGESPAALLAGSNEIERLFRFSDKGTAEGLSWLEATPRSKEGSFESVRLGFRGNDILAMEVRDNFGQVTRLRFSNIKRNPAIAAELFRFTPPKGVDVIGDP